MTPPTPPRPTIRFDIFEVDLPSSELRKAGHKIKLQEQPFRVLTMLLERPSEIVTREEIRQQLWPADTFVDFDHGLNSAVARLREALNDSADNPRFVETIPRQGYRFVCAVERDGTGRASTAESPSTSVPVITSAGRRNAWIAAAALLTVLAGFFAWRLAEERLDPPSASMTVVPLAGMPGQETNPAFSPDGKEVAFIEHDGQDSGIYVSLVGGERPLRLTHSAEDCCPAWSPDARQVAFLRLFGTEAGVYVVPALGGTERRLYIEPCPLYPSLSWSSDGKLLAFPENKQESGRSWITLFSPADGSTRALTSPSEIDRDDSAVFSPDGSMVAFVRGTIAGVVNDFYVIPTRGGEPTRLTFDNTSTGGVSWTPDSRDIIFSSPRGGQFALWRMSASGGTPRPLAVGAPASSPSVARNGNMLAYTQAAWRDSIWRISLADEKRAAGPPVLVVSEKGSKLRPHFSPDGKKIAFESDRLGSYEIWVCDSDGANCGELTSLHGTAGTTAWSPDGRYLAFEFHPGERAEIYVVEFPAGTPRLLTTIPGADNLVPTWSRDGKSLYFTSKQGSGPFQLWKIPFHGGHAVQITKNGGLDAVESADGRFLYYAKYEAGGIWRMPLAGGAETRVLDRPRGPEWPNWALSRDGIYFISESESLAARMNPSSPSSLEFFDFLTRKTTRISTLDKPARWGLALAPDGRSLVYVEAEFEESSIMLVKNFH